MHGTSRAISHVEGTCHAGVCVFIAVIVTSNGPTSYINKEKRLTSTKVSDGDVYICAHVVLCYLLILCLYPMAVN